MAKIVTTLFGSLELLPFQAQTPLAENLEFMTDLFQSFNGTEQRLALRSIARQKYKYIVPVSLDKIAAMFNSQYNAIRKQWAIPIWSQAQYVGTVAAGVAAIACDTTMHDLRTNSLAFLFNGSSWQIVEISTIAAGSVTPNIALTAMQQAYIMPVRLAHITGDIQTTTTGYNGQSQITFQVDDIAQIVPAAPTQYLGNDIYYDVSLLGTSNMARNITQRQDILDYDLGIISYRAPWLNSEYQSAYYKLCASAQDMQTFKNFLYRRQGKFRAFWMPTFDLNFRVTQTGAVANVLTFYTDNYLDYSPRGNLAIATNDGVWHPFAVTGSVDLGNGVTEITLNGSLGYDASQITNVSYIGLNRLDTDSIDITWNGNGEAESTYNIMEISP